MKWLEIIELRSTILDNTALKNELTDILIAINAETKEKRIKLFSSDSIGTDFCIYIEHFSGPPIKKSKLGRNIYMVLKDLGLTNHKIWVEIENDGLKS